MVEKEMETSLLENSSEERLDEVSAETVVSPEETIPEIDYLSPDLFENINVYNKEDLDQEGVEEEIPAERWLSKHPS